jgi:hypothetical protein
MWKIGTQLAIHRTDQSKLFPMIVLRQYARVSYASRRAILGMLCSDSDILHRVSSRAYAPKMQAFARQSANWSSVAVKPCGMDLNPASKVLRSDSVALIGCPRGVSFVLPWFSANPPILDEWSAIRKLSVHRE